MSVASDLRSECKDTATWKPVLSRTKYSVPVYGTSVPLSFCRLVVMPRRVRNAQGDEVVSSAHLWVMEDHAIKADDVVVLSDATEPVVISTERRQDEQGNFTYVKVFF